MKITTWNINGIRAACKNVSLKKLLDSFDSDIICLQETKITRDMLDTEIAIVDGYHAFFSFSKLKSGYSGVVTYCKGTCTPTAAEEGLTGTQHEQSNPSSIKCDDMNFDHFSVQDLTDLNAEGRAVLTEHSVNGNKTMVLVNVYCPRACKDNEERWKYKQMFYKFLQTRCEHLLLCGKNVIIVGDFNVSHTKLDHCDPDFDEEYFDSNESRMWMSNFLLKSNKINESSVSDYDKKQMHQEDSASQQKKFIDLFRHFHPARENAFTCWSTVTGARKTNYGTRIDYIIADQNLTSKHAVTCDIRPDIHGSDHCPVEAVFDCEVKSSDVLPAICSELMPEFRGKQQSIRSFMVPITLKVNTELVNCKANSMNASLNLIRSNRVDIFTKSFGGVKRKSDISHSGIPPKKKNSKELNNKPRSTFNNNLKSYFSQNNKQSTEDRNEKIITNSVNVCSSNILDKQTARKNDASTNQLEKSNISCDEALNLINADPKSQDNELNIKSSYVEDSAKLDVCKNGNSTLTGATIEKDKISKLHWKNILKGPDPPPLCKGHKEECVLRTVKKQGPNNGRQFYCCARPEGRISDKEARCGTFIWKKRTCEPAAFRYKTVPDVDSSCDR